MFQEWRAIGEIEKVIGISEKKEKGELAKGDREHLASEQTRGVDRPRARVLVEQCADIVVQPEAPLIVTAGSDPHSSRFCTPGSHSRFACPANCRERRHTSSIRLTPRIGYPKTKGLDRSVLHTSSADQCAESGFGFSRRTTPAGRTEMWFS